MSGRSVAALRVVTVAAGAPTGVRRLGVAYALSVLGIAFGLSSARVVGLARGIHLVLVPLAIAGIPLLVAAARSSRSPAVPSARG